MTQTRTENQRPVTEPLGFHVLQYPSKDWQQIGALRTDDSVVMGHCLKLKEEVIVVAKNRSHWILNAKTLH
jgi:hypothetical protein